METKGVERPAKELKKPGVVLPKGAIELQPGVYVMREVRSAFSALNVGKVSKDSRR